MNDSNHEARRVLGRLAGQATITGGRSFQQICGMEADKYQTSRQGVIYTAAGVIHDSAGSSTPPNPRVVIRITIGGGNPGGGTSKVVRYTVAGVPVPFAGSTVMVEALVAPNENADFSQLTGLPPLADTIVSEVNAVIALGTAAEGLPTQWIVPALPLQSAQQVTQGVTRLKAVQGYSAGPANGYLMFFDTIDEAGIADGADPLFAIPYGALPGDGTTSADWFSDDFVTSSRIFNYGMAWVASSTPDTLTRDAGALLRVDVELYSEALPS